MTGSPNGFPFHGAGFDASPGRGVRVGRGAHVLAPYLRGFGSTRFLDDATIRSGQQGALAQDLLDFLDALRIENAVLAGYDWPGGLHRRRNGNAPTGTSAKDLLADEPSIEVPTVVLESGADGVGGPSAAGDREFFTGTYEHRYLDGIGHNVPQEAPDSFADAVASLLA